MKNKILGLHHITAIAGNARRNFEFYTRVLGLRLVKKTVNFDDPGTYHFYFGDKVGTPGTILTFFPWKGITQGSRGVGMATEFAYSVPAGSLEFWRKRFETHNVTHALSEKFGEMYLSFFDPDGLKIGLTVPAVADTREPWTTEDVTDAAALRGFHHVTLSLNKAEKTAEILETVFGYRLQQRYLNQSRYVTDAVPHAALIDIVESPGDQQGLNAGGTVHHIAFRVKDDASALFFRERLLEKGLQPTSIIDRNYFHSVYFREPGGVLFELATENPGFTVDEPEATLGTALKLPQQFEHRRYEIEQVLPSLADA